MVCKLRSQAKPWTNNTGPQDNTHPSTTPPTIHLQHSGSLPTGHCTTLQYRSLMHSSRNWLGREGKGTTDEYPSCKYQITHSHTIHSWNRCLRDIHPPMSPLHIGTHSTVPPASTPTPYTPAPTPPPLRTHPPLLFPNPYT